MEVTGPQVVVQVVGEGPNPQLVSCATSPSAKSGPEGHSSDSGTEMIDIDLETGSTKGEADGIKCDNYTTASSTSDGSDGFSAGDTDSVDTGK